MLANHTAGVSLYLLFSLRKMAICGIITSNLRLKVTSLVEASSNWVQISNLSKEVI